MFVMVETPARILIVDDHPNTAAMLARVLSKFPTPVEIMTAQSGEDALNMIGDKIIDILITDFMMVGMNGLDLIDTLKGDRKPAHTIMITAYDTPGLKISANRLQVNDYLVKPVQPEKIRDIVSRVLSEIRPNLNVENKLKEEALPSKILIADDNPDNIRLLSVRLQSEGYHFISAYDGQETLAKIRSELPDLVLLDVNMPIKDGFEVLMEMRGDPEISHVPVIVVTAARIGAKDIREGLTLGADDYVTKPVDWRELSARIRTKLRVKQAEDSLRRRNEALGVLPEISKDLRDQPDIEHLTSNLLEKAIEALKATHGFLFLLNPDRKITQHLHSPLDISPKAWEELIDRIATNNFIHHVLDSRRGIVTSNTDNGENWIQIPSGSTQSVMVVPFIGRRDTLGVLVLTHESPSYFTPDHLKIGEAIASQAAIALENAQLVVMERKRVDEMVALNQLSHQISRFTRSGELFKAVPGLVRRHLGYPAVTIWTLHEKGLHLETIDGEENAPRRSLIELAPQQAVQTGEPIQFSGPIEERVGDRSGSGHPPLISTIAVPISWNGSVKGVLSSISPRPGTFQESDRVLMETLASQIGIVLERISLFESVEQEQKQLSAVLHAAADAIMVISSEGNLQIINPAGTKLFTDVNTRVGHPLPSGKGYDGLLTVIEKARQSGNLESAEIHWPDDRTFSVMVAPIQEGGEVVVLHDVSHFMKINQIKNEFLATASHDLKNPIFSVLGYSDLIEKVGALNDLQKDFISRIRNAANQMQDLVLNLLEIARIEMETDFKKEPVDLNGLLHEIFEEFQAVGKTQEHDMQLELTVEQISVNGDKMRLQQVARNLLSNAIKYTPKGGSVLLRTRTINGRVYVDVQDTGIGIPEEAIPNLFQKFFRVHTDATQDIEGNGLGLAIAKSIIEQHGGEISVTSKEQEGSCFSFSLAVSNSLENHIVADQLAVR
jgi:signal transduction histidine kinase/DNA-binding response OmpR family regulator